MGLWNISKRNFDIVKLKIALNNPLTRKYVSYVLEKTEDGKTRLDNILENYNKYNKRFGFLPLEIIRKGLRISKEDFSKQLKRPLIRRVILASFNSVNDYGLQIPQTFSVPLMLVWNITNKCNLKCIHCYQDAGILRKRKEKKEKELSLKEKLNVIDKIVDAGIPTLAFSGGEPLIDKDFWKVARKAKENDLYMSLNTNGTLLTKENVKKIKNLGFAYIGVSLDGASAKVHDKFRGINGMFDKTMEGIKNLIEEGLQDITCISYTWSKQNYEELPKMLKLRDKLGLRKVVVYNFIPCGRGNFSNDTTAEQREKGYEIMYNDSLKNPGKLLCTAPQFGRYCIERARKSKENATIVLSHFGTGRIKELGVLAEIIGGCGAGRAYIALQPNGDISPCVYTPSTVLGNIRKDSFLDVWKNSSLLKLMRDRENFEGNCGKCENNKICGGCRARAYVYTNNYNGADPGCIKNAELFCNLNKNFI